MTVPDAKQPMSEAPSDEIDNLHRVEKLDNMLPSSPTKTYQSDDMLGLDDYDDAASTSSVRSFMRKLRRSMFVPPSLPTEVVIPTNQAKRASQTLLELNALLGLPVVMEEPPHDVLLGDLPPQTEDSQVEPMPVEENQKKQDDDKDDMVDPLDSHMVGTHRHGSPRRSDDISWAGTSMQTTRTVDTSHWDQISLVRAFPIGFANHCNTAGAAWITTL